VVSAIQTMTQVCGGCTAGRTHKTLHDVINHNDVTLALSLHEFMRNMRFIGI